MTSRGSKLPSLGSHSLNILILFFVGTTTGWIQAAQSQSQVTKHDITWTFDRAYTVGQFINGDWWVLDDGSGVRVTGVSPSPNGSGSSYRHGSMINPVGDAQGYDGRLYDYTPSLSVSYPVTLQGGKSLVSAISITTQSEACDTGKYVDIYGHCVNEGHSFMWKAACLTVVSQIPAADAFRPPYAGNNKVIHRGSEIQWDILPGLPLASKPSLTTVNKISNCFREIWLEKSYWTGRMIHPLKNQPNYGREIGSAVSEASALLMLDYSQSEINDLLIGFLQTGIDLYAISQNGVSWRGEGGHDNGRKWPIVFAGIMLNDAGMKSVNGSFGEDGQTYYGQAASSNSGQSKVAFFGQDCVSPYTETCSGSGAKDCRDPSGLKDACPDYRNCCSSHTWVGQALAAEILDAESVWNHGAFFDYVDRWMRFGNDPPVDGGGSSQISYIDAMWQTYRAGLEEVDNMPPLAPTGLTMQSSGLSQITLQWNAPSPATDGDRASSYRVYRNQVMLQGVTATSFTDSGLAASTSYSYAVYSVDNVGNVSSGAATGTFATLADSDGDNLPDNWENQYFSNLSETASGNPDGDALTNLDEYLRGTNPTVFDDLPSDLVLHLLMDDDPADGVQDSSEYGQTGTVVSSSAPALGAGRVNLGYTFDGITDYIRFSNTSLQGEFPGASGNPASSMTLAAWIKLSSLNDRHPILVKQTEPQRGFVFSKESDNTLALELSSDGVGNQTYHSNTTLHVDTWYHVAATYSPLSNGSVTLYINGVADGHYENVGGAPFGNAQDLNVGRYYWSDAYSRYFHGVIDEVRVYHRALSDAEIQNLSSISGGNSAPRFDSLGTQSVEINTPLAFTVNATDSDGDSLSYSASNLPNGAVFDPGTRQFNWTPGDGDAGTYTATFSVSDGKGGTDILGVTIQVTQPAGSITSNGSWQSVSIVPQSDLFTLEFDATPLATNIDGVTGLSNGVAGAYSDLAVVVRFYTNGFIDARNGSVYAAENSVAYQENMTYHFRLEVDVPNHRYNAYVKPEGGSEVLLGSQFAFRSEQQAATTLTTVSLAPGGPHRVANIQIATYSPNQAPVLNPVGNRTVRENSQLFFTVSATDPDGDALIYFAENLPFGAAFTGNIFYWTPSLNDAGVYDVTFVVNDTRNGSDSETIQITVEDFNQSPLFDAIGDQTVQENEPLSFTVSGGDPDGNFLTYSASNLPTGATFADQTFSWTPTFDQAGSYEVTFTITDGELEDTALVAIDVNNVNRPPILDPIADVNVNENLPIIFSVSASDPDGDAVSYSILNLPTGADFTNQTFTWTPGANDAGSYQVTVIANDGQLQDAQVVHLTVGDMNQPPALDPIGPQTVSENELLNFSISASDPDGDDLTYTAADLPAGADLTGQLFQWTPTLVQAGTYTITITVSDGQSQDSKAVTLTVLNTNQPPALDPIGPRSVNENQLLNFSVNASDPDGDDLTYTATNLPTGASLAGQLFQWTPTLEQAGTYTITVIVSDGQLQDSETVTLTALNTNQPPTLDPIGSQAISESQLLSFSLSASDPDGDTLIFTAIGLPTGASLSDQIFNWTPTKDQDGIYNITVIASDGQLQDSEAFAITVLNGNRPPALDPIDPQSVQENSELSFIVNASDPDDDTLQYSISPLPSGAAFSNQTFTWKPGFTDAGSYSLTIAASDGELQDTETVDITVNNKNRGPHIDPPGNKKVKESSSLSFQVSASDPDGDVVSYSTETLPTGASLEADAFTWTPTYDDAGLYDVTFIASDGELQSTQTVSIEVENVNRAPVLADVAAIAVAENEPVQFFVTATDPDQDAVTYSAANLPAGAEFTNQAFNWTPDFDDAGVYDVSVAANDGELEDYLTVTIVVGSTNRPPVFDPVTDPGVNENEPLDLTISASDPDGDELTLQALNLPEGAQFQGTALQWTPSFEQAGNYVITFEANDGTVTVRKDVSVTVNNVNRVPVIQLTEDLLVNENEFVQAILTATDPDGDPVTVEVMQLPDGASFSGEALSWTPDFDDAGVYIVRVKASDGLAEDNQDLTITVNNVNRPPTLQTLNEQIILADDLLNVAVTAIDPDGDPVVLTAGNLPDGATFDGANLRWTPTWEQEGSYGVVVTASDGDLQDSITVALSVVIGNRPPVITAPPNFYVNANEIVQFTVQASDPDGDTVTVSNSGLPGGAQFSGQSFSWTPDADQSGITIVTFTADDGELQSSATVLIYVLPGIADSVPPAVTRVSPRSNAIQVERNTLIVAELADTDSGIDPATVSIQADGEIIYQGNVSQYESSLGICRRSGTPVRYTYILQPLGYFENDQTVTLRIQARDQAGNTMTVFQSQFTTEMYTFGVAHQVNADPATCDHPVTVRDAAGAIWITWEQGNPGSRRIKVSRKAGGQSSIVTPAETTGDQTQAALAVGNGQVYLTWQEKINNRWQVFLSHSSDGTNWATPVQISQTNGNQIHPAVAAQDQTVYVAWQDDRSGNQDIFTARSDDGFATHTVQVVTQNTANQLDPVVTLANGSAYAVWTDLRNGTTDLYGAASHTGWANVAVVNHPANQSQPALASFPDASSLYLSWVDDRSGNNDVFYAVLPAGLGSTPTSGVNLVDDTLGRDQTAPSILVTQRNGVTKAFVSWQDERHSSPDSDNDIYFAAVQSGQPTNVLVTAESSGADQTVPALGAGAQGEPYLVWIDQRSKGQDVYCTGATNITGEQVAAQSVTTASGGIVGTPVAEIDSVEDVSAEVPVGAFPSDVMLTIFRVDNPVGGESVGEVLSAYDFGPSIDGEFAKPVTLTIPYEVTDPKVQADIFWYNPQTGELTQAGLSQIEMIEITPTLRAFRFRTSHFSQFVLGEVDTSKPRRSSGGGGGCTLGSTERHSASLVEYLLPWFILSGVIGWIRRKAPVITKEY